MKQKAGLEEKRYAVLELAKGKFTSDPSRHSGEGIFFSSKIADNFLIMSDDMTYAGQFDQEKGLLMDNDKSYNCKGTPVFQSKAKHVIETK